MSGNFIECARCGSELIFKEESKESPHAFRAVCTQCKTKKGKERFDSWVSWEQMEEIAKRFPYTKIIESQQ